MPRFSSARWSPSRAAIVGILGFGLVVLWTPAWAAAVERPAIGAGRSEVSRVARTVPLRGGLRLEGLFLEQFGSVDLELERFRVFAEDARVGHGAQWRQAPANAYLRGEIEGFPGSLAVLSFRERGGIGGWIQVGGDYWQISGRAGVGGLTSVKTDKEDPAGSPPFDCQTDNLPASLQEAVSAVSAASADGFEPPIPSASSSGSYSYSARVAVDTDWEFLEIFGGDEAAATDYVGDLFAFGSSIYEAEIDTSLTVSFLRFWPGAATDDPWSATDCSGQLGEFRNYWWDNHDTEVRAVAHMLSGKATGCGIAYVGVLCNNTFGYGVSGSLTGSFDPVDPLPPVWDILVFTHEIGHNFGSPHTHCYNGLPDVSYPDPVDPCYTANGCYSGTVGLPASCPGSGQGCGTIMSYCHLRSGGYGNISMTLGGSVLDGSSHPYGVFPERVPERMHDHVLSKAASGCLDPVVSGQTLSVAKAGNGTGTVTSTPAGIDCGADCAEDYDYGTVVTLSAAADTGSTFTDWSGDADCADGQVTMTTATSCTATFTLDTHTLTVTKVGAGSGAVTTNPAGIDCGSVCQASYSQGTVVQLQTVPEPGSLFVGWSGEADCGDAEVGMNKNRACTATFDLEPVPPHLLTVTTTGTGSGTVTSAPNGIDCGGDCSEPYVAGSEVMLTAARGGGATFEGWEGACSGSEPDAMVAMMADMDCTARFDACADLKDISAQVVSDSQFFEACSVLLAGDFEIQGPMGNVTLMVGETIILGNGFEVHSGASFTAIVDPALQP